MNARSRASSPDIAISDEGSQHSVQGPFARYDYIVPRECNILNEEYLDKNLECFLKQVNLRSCRRHSTLIWNTSEVEIHQGYKFTILIFNWNITSKFYSIWKFCESQSRLIKHDLKGDNFEWGEVFSKISKVVLDAGKISSGDLKEAAQQV